MANINSTPPCTCYFTSSVVSSDGMRYAQVGGILGDYSSVVEYVFSSLSRVNVSDVFAPTGYHSWYGGKSIALSANGTRVALGGQTGTGWGSNGFVRVFEESGGNWSQIGGDINIESGERFLRKCTGIFRRWYAPCRWRARRCGTQRLFLHWWIGSLGRSRTLCSRVSV